MNLILAWNRTKENSCYLDLQTDETVDLGHNPKSPPPPPLPHKSKIPWHLTKWCGASFCSCLLHYYKTYFDRNWLIELQWRSHFSQTCIVSFDVAYATFPSESLSRGSRHTSFSHNKQRLCFYFTMIKFKGTFGTNMGDMVHGSGKDRRHLV